jgi:23S rRNA (cytosine1962-C5)-methyltransferase
VWQIERDLPGLLKNCGALLAEDAGFLLVSCHSPGIGAADLRRLLLNTIPRATPQNTESCDLGLATADGRQLHCGVSASWTRQ